MALRIEEEMEMARMAAEEHFAREDLVGGRMQHLVDVRRMEDGSLQVRGTGLREGIERKTYPGGWGPEHADYWPFWEDAGRHAEEQNHCSAYDRMARHLGGPTRAELRKHAIQKYASVPEPEPGAIVTFDKVMGPRTYHYAAIQGLPHRWHTTGQTCPPDGYSWPELLDFAGGPDRVRTMDLAAAGGLVSASR